MTQENHNEIILSIGRLEGKVDTGFLAVTQRMDTANGRTSKLEGKVELIEKQQARADGRLTAYGWIFGGGISIIGIILVCVQIYFSIKH